MVLPYDQTGAGPAVILLHAGVADRRMWGEHLPPLAAAGYRAIAVDLPGFGDAGRAAGASGPWMSVVETMDALGVDSAALVGNSYGAAVAMRAAVVAPERVSALALISAPPIADAVTPRLQAVWEAEEAAMERGDIDAAVAAVLDAWTLPDAPEALRRRVATMQRRALELALEAPASSCAGEHDEPADPLEPFPQTVERLKMPTLVAVGEHDMPDFLAVAEALARALPAAASITIERAGHLAPLETPEIFRKLLLDLLSCTPRTRRRGV